ncbi:MAG: carbohydrate ABC transporter permease, partial [Elusimicrobia bacterium]|nr:carbohydrate ABC transporter permease [Elusimicrobiota bacterium]
MKKVFLGVGIFFLAAWSLIPFFWQVATSLKPASLLTVIPPLLPLPPTGEHYRVVLQDPIFLRMIFNSFGIGVCVGVLSLLVGSLAAFAIAFFPIRSKSLILALALMVSMFPGISLIGPLYLLIRFLHLRDTWWALILVHTVLT